MCIGLKQSFYANYADVVQIKRRFPAKIGLTV